MKAQANERTTSGYKDLARKFISELDRWHPETVIEAAKAKGVEALHDNTRKQVILKIPGVGDMPWRQALANGIVSPGKK